jgi:hypothetical protein
VLDTLAYANKLKAAGVPSDQAEAHAEALNAATIGLFATKQDIDQLKQDMDSRFEALEERIDVRFETFKHYVDARFEASEQRIDARFKAVDARFETLEERHRGRFQLLQWMLGFNLALSVAIIFMLFRLIIGNGLTP